MCRFKDAERKVIVIFHSPTNLHQTFSSFVIVFGNFTVYFLHCVLQPEFDFNIF